MYVNLLDPMQNELEKVFEDKFFCQSKFAQEIEKIESEITKNEEFLGRITEELNKATTMNDTQKLTDFTHAVGKLNNLIDDLFEKLSNANENLDFVNKHYDVELDKLNS